MRRRLTQQFRALHLGNGALRFHQSAWIDVAGILRLEITVVIDRQGEHRKPVNEHIAAECLYTKTETVDRGKGARDIISRKTLTVAGEKAACFSEKADTAFGLDLRITADGALRQFRPDRIAVKPACDARLIVMT
ncbi:hypothetical protein D3C87_1803120 [compost metagenome]